MGVKGDTSTGASAETARVLLEKLEALGAVSSKKMFGGYGIFLGGKMFAMVDSKGRVLLKATEDTRAFFERQGCERHDRMPYYLVPQEILLEEALLLDWAGKAVKALGI